MSAVGGAKQTFRPSDRVPTRGLRSSLARAWPQRTRLKVNAHKRKAILAGYNSGLTIRALGKRWGCPPGQFML